jgi:hypothetical protein
MGILELECIRLDSSQFFLRLIKDRSRRLFVFLSAQHTELTTFEMRIVDFRLMYSFIVFYWGIGVFWFFSTVDRQSKTHMYSAVCGRDGVNARDDR